MAKGGAEKSLDMLEAISVHRYMRDCIIKTIFPRGVPHKSTIPFSCA